MYLELDLSDLFHPNHATHASHYTWGKEGVLRIGAG